MLPARPGSERVQLLLLLLVLLLLFFLSSCLLFGEGGRGGSAWPAEADSMVVSLPCLVPNARSIIHRDLKSSNLLIANDRLKTVKICDFSMSRLQGEQSNPRAQSSHVCGAQHPGSKRLTVGRAFHGRRLPAGGSRVGDAWLGGTGGDARGV